MVQSASSIPSTGAKLLSATRVVTTGPWNSAKSRATTRPSPRTAASCTAGRV